MLEGRELLRLVDDPEAVGGIDEEVGGVLDGPARPDGRSERLHEEGRRLDPGAVPRRLPADAADRLPAADAGVAEELDQRLRSVTGLIRQTQLLPQNGIDRERRDPR